MAISGEMSKRDQWSYWLGDSAACFLFSGGGVVFFLFIIHLIGAPPDPTLRVAAIASFPVLGLVGLSFLIWDDRHTVVEFTCDDDSLWFRKLGCAETEVRLVSEIDRLEGRLAKSGIAGTTIHFRDGSRAFVPYGHGLSNAEELNNQLSALTQRAAQLVSASTT